LAEGARVLIRDWRAWLVLLCLAGAALRFHSLGLIHIWEDETDFFHEGVYGDPHVPLTQFAFDRPAHATNSTGWYAAVWLSLRVFGGSIAGARTVTALAGSAAIPAFFFLILFAAREMESPRASALIAAGFAAISVPMIEFSQRTYAYGAVPLFAALLIYAHLELAEALRESARPDVWVWVRFSIAASVGWFMHPSLALLIAASGLVLARRLLRWHAVVAGVPILIAAYVNRRPLSVGFRPYLSEYYPPHNFNAIPFFLTRTYDLLSYLLNLFFDPRFYWPLSVNVILLPLIALSVGGWALSAGGRAGRGARDMAIYGALAFAIQAGLSCLSYFPFGGVRQSFFLAPFVIGFAAIGAGGLCQRAYLKKAVICLGGLYVGLWAWRIPALYIDRISVYSGAEIVSIWKAEDKLPIYAPAGSAVILRYETRPEPDMHIEMLDGFRPEVAAQLPEEFLMVSPRFPLEKSYRNPDMMQQMKDAGYESRLLMERPAAHLASMEHPTMLYFPPNGLWVYRIKKVAARGSARLSTP